ncbi:MAG: prolipoprotein diacylglyceryl transferase [Bacteriovoracia bacterium]
MSIHPFGVMCFCGFIFGMIRARSYAKKLGFDEVFIAQLFLTIVGGGVCGSLLFSLFAYKVFGQSLVGAVVGGGIAVTAFCLLKKLSVRACKMALDITAMSAVVGFGMGRVGCFFAKDHPGVFSNFFLAVQYPDGRRHDLGLYEALFFWIVLFPVTSILSRKTVKNKKASGQICAAFIILYAIIRFFLDFLRESRLPTADVRYFGLTPAQYVALVAIFTALVLRMISVFRGKGDVKK